ncbi:DegT/DnrJ/EryC1/StrS family aminotransferase [Membranicola marinus]|uniref:DegT/DnrJ/EryC1/StrS family aminotransferase n=1 Tax=Membranihabitans marinus TaxID=1227546 RepID=A0A953HWP0_9BACT|nr:DegT/DnrJ/EryC1/StrS family aminotransferase [Membranihabitans marinus]MBY5959541.1 DegT/DnrJ/EryC1/StrS family aminotransferase [Membranihabitans marinus]
MKNSPLNRRKFIKVNAVAGLGASVALSHSPTHAFDIINKVNQTPAILGGNPMVDHDWPSWPIWNPETDEKRLLEVMRSGVWSRKNVTIEFEKKWAETIGSKRCLALVNGTNALNTSFANLDIGWGDEVITTPYSFIASAQSILFNGAIPIFVDVDPKTFQIDPSKIEEIITDRTKAILPVHILGLPCDMDPIMKIAAKHDLRVVEDACQGWLAEYDHKKVGTFGDAGCFSFQNSKNIPIGEGGAIVSDDDEFMDRCYSYHNYGMPYGSTERGAEPGAVLAGTKLRITEYQCAIGLAQLERLEEQTEKRSDNARYLRNKISEISGIVPYELYPKVTRAAFHLFPFRYMKDDFKGLPRGKFLAALRAEGVPCSPGYTPLNKMPFLENTFNSKNFKRFYADKDLNYADYRERNECPLNDVLCAEEAVWIPQYVLLGSKGDMDAIHASIQKIYNHAEKLK